MNFFAVLVVALSVLSSSVVTAVESDTIPEPVDYGTLAHTVSVASLRAGAHDESGTNDYFFKATMYGLVNSPDERNLPLDKRKKIEVDLGTFGETQIVALGLWKADEKTKQVKELKVSGNQIRELTARVMQEQKIVEGDVSVMVELAMVEKGKKFWFFGEDINVGKVAYEPIPALKAEAPPATGTELLLSDDKGTLVKFTVVYPPKS